MMSFDGFPDVCAKCGKGGCNGGCMPGVLETEKIPDYCRCDTPHAAHTWGGRPMRFCPGVIVCPPIPPPDRVFKKGG